ncbi:MAG: alpha/beta fold hydrolase [Chloroflexi bacterium]|nr:alpha/beta fold hydrolase [Chloroflexota bacterium]
MESRTVSVRNGLFKIDVPQQGSGEPLLFLHGSGGLHDGEYLNLLAQTFTVYAPSHPGFGASEGIEHIDDIIDFALYYHDLMDELGLESAHIVGHSLGGMIAAEIAALCPHRVRRLVLANPVGLWRDDDPVLDFITMPADKLMPYILHDPESDAMKEAFPAPEGRDAIMEAMFERMKSFTTAGKFLWPIPDRGLKRRIHRIQSPTLIVWGESDRLVPPSYAEDFRAGIKNSRVVILKEAAHMPMFEKRDEFVSLVTEFLQES